MTARWTLGAAMLAGAMTLVASRTPTTGETCPPRRADVTYETALARLTDRVAFWIDRATSQGDWPTLARLAAIHQERARLTGAWDDYAAADSLLELAFQRAPAGSGPHLARAGLRFTLHRFDRVEEDLRAAESRVLLDDRTRAAIVGLRADVALQCGRYDEARQGLEESLRLHASPTALARLASYHAATGNAERADSLLAEAARRHDAGSGPAAAWFELRRGILDLEANRLDEALAHYREANAKLSGWWLVEEHVAEIAARRGEGAHVVATYRDLVERTGNPEFMDALARIHAESGDEAAAAQWIARADRAYRESLARFPEAACGHALEHYLEFGDDPELAMELAERNWQLRPNGQAAELRAAALRDAGRGESKKGK